MEQFFAIMALVGAFLCLSMAICLAFSIEAEESELASDIMTILLFIGIVCFLTGLFGSIFIIFL
jgi:uncharacterized membrane protein